MSFLTVLFDKNQKTCFARQTFENNLFPAIRNFNGVAGTVIEYSPPTSFFVINALEGGRKNSDVVCFRNILVEMDTLSLEEQAKLIHDVEMPFSTQVFSGNKSYHYIISLETPLANLVQYQRLVKRVYAAVGRELVDTACGNPARFSRMPGGVRDDGAQQTLIYTGARIPNSDIESWLEKRGIKKEDDIEAPNQPPTLLGDEYALSPKTGFFLEWGAAKGQWHQALLHAANDMARCGFTLDQTTTRLRKVTGTLDSHDERVILDAYEYQSKQCGWVKI